MARFRKGPPRVAESFGPGDGQDPRYDRDDFAGKVANRKALQLCAQVRRTLAVVLAGEGEDDILRDLMVESVVPAPHAGRLLVTVYPATSAALAAEDVLGRLHRAQPRLRAEVAAAIHRRKTPELVFRVVRAG